jgi:hypothetical protein
MSEERLKEAALKIAQEVYAARDWEDAESFIDVLRECAQRGMRHTHAELLAEVERLREIEKQAEESKRRGKELYEKFRGFTVLVTGGRDFADRRWLSEVLTELNARYNFRCLIHGAARGADSLAEEWGLQNGVYPKPFPADWQKHGRKAGPIRNAEMLKEKPDLVIAFPGGKGTADMVKRAKQAGIEVIEVGESFL